MKHAGWFIGAGICLVSALGFASCAALVARGPEPVLDAAEMTQEEVAEIPLQGQFDLVAEHYRIFNDTVSESQRVVHDGDWVSAESTNVFMTLRGSNFNGALKGKETKDNSYHLTRYWLLEDVADAEAKLDKVKAFWDQLGWDTGKRDSDVIPGEFHVSGKAADGTLIMIDMMGSDLALKAYSGVYWGDRKALSKAIWNIQQNERNEGIEWWPERVNEDGYGLIRPGEYPPYPAWNDVAYEERLEASPHWDKRRDQSAKKGEN